MLHWFTQYILHCLHSTHNTVSKRAVCRPYWCERVGGVNIVLFFSGSHLWKCVYKTPTFFMTMQGVTPLLSWTSCAARNGEFWNIHRTHPIWVHAITISSPKWRTTAWDPVPHRRWSYQCYRAVNTEHQQRWARWWFTTPSKHLEKVINKVVTILNVHKCCTTVNKAMSEISNCYYFLSNPCIQVDSEQACKN